MATVTKPEAVFSAPGAKGHPAPAERRKVALFGIFGIQNLGNECTLDAMLNAVRERLPEAEIQVIGYDPADTFRRHQVPTLSIVQRIDDQQTGARGRLRRLFRLLFRRLPGEVGHWLGAVRALRGTELMIMTGTGMLTDYSTTAFGYPYDLFKWTTAARIAGCKVRFVGIGVGPLYQRLSRIFVDAALRWADYRSYRDDRSHHNLRQLGLGKDSDPVYPDLAFSLPRRLFARPRAAVQRRFTVGLGVMRFVDRHASTEQERESSYQRYLVCMCEFVEWLVARGYGIRILQGDARHDPAVRRELREKLQSRGTDYAACGIADEESTCTEDLVPQLAETDIVVSPRFHNLVLAMMLAKPVISISYDPKNDALLEGFGLGQYRQAIAEVQTQKLIEQFKEVEGARERIAARLRKGAEEYRTRLEQQYSLILGDLGQAGIRS